MIEAAAIAKHLQDKLNTAIVNDIANNDNTAFNNDFETYRFLVKVDTGKYKGYDYLKRSATSGALDGTFAASELSLYRTNKTVYYINAIMNIIDSDVEGTSIKGENGAVIALANKVITLTANVEFLVPLTDEGDDFTQEMAGAVRNILDDAMSLNSYDDFDGYNMGVSYSLAETGSRSIRGGVGDSVTLYSTITYYFVEGGINSTQFRLSIDGVEIAAPIKGINRISEEETGTDLSSDDSSAKAVQTSSVLTVNFSKPTQNGAFDYQLLKWIAQGGSVGHLVSLEFPSVNGEPSFTMQKIMCFKEGGLNIQQSLNASNDIILVEAMTGNKVITLSPEAEAFLYPENGG